MITNRTHIYDYLLSLAEKYGLLVIIAFSYSLMTPNLKAKGGLMDSHVEDLLSAGTSSNLIKQLIWTSFFLIYLVCLIREAHYQRILKQSWSKILTLTGPIAIILATSFWSEFPSFTIKRTIFQIFLIFGIFFATYFAVKHRTFDLTIRVILSWMVLLTLVSLVLGVGYDPLGLTGYVGHKNGYGAQILAGVCVYLCLDKSRRDLYFLIPLMAFLILSMSKTSMALTLVICILFGLNIAVSRIFFTILAYGISTAFLIAPLVTALIGDLWFPSINADRGFMTGRGAIWQVLYPDILEGPKTLYGYGYGAFFNTGSIPAVMDVKDSFLRYLNQSHNSYLDLALQIGFPLSILMMSSIILIIRQTDIKQAYLAGVALLVYSISEASIFRDQQSIWVTFLVVLSWALATRSISSKQG